MTATNPPKLGAMLLAAGGSSRFGRPKQLVQFEGESLLRRSARSLAESVYFPVVVVLGAEADAVLNEISGLPVYSVVNDDWAQGMGLSIKVGLTKLLDLEPDLDAVLISLSDQPQITGEMLNPFAARFYETSSDVIASTYDGVQGVPALFSRKLFGELSLLQGDKGARHIIRNHYYIDTIDLPEAAIDIDTVDDAADLGITDHK